MRELQLGDYVTCKANGNMEFAFTGQIEKIYENSILVAMTNYDSKDQSNAHELNMRAVISKRCISPVENSKQSA